VKFVIFHFNHILLPVLGQEGRVLEKPSGTGKRSSFSGWIGGFFQCSSFIVRSRAGKNYKGKLLVWKSSDQPKKSPVLAPAPCAKGSATQLLCESRVP